MEQGAFITFEGIDGSGKTTQLNLIKSFLEKQGFDCIVTREPGAADFGKKIREIILNSKENISDSAEMFLFLADRAQHVHSLIKPSLKDGKIVLCDRYVDSTLAYQGYGRGQDIKILKNLNDIATDGVIPNLTLLFDISADTALNRVGKDKDRMEAIGLAFQKRVRNGYLELMEREPARIKLINADNPVDMVYNNTKDIVRNLIRKLGG